MDKPKIRERLAAIVGARHVLHEREDVMLYEYDGALDKAQPDFVIFPETTEQVAAIVKLANEQQIPFAPRGAGTGLSGGAIPVQGGIVIVFSRMRRILRVDLANRLAVVQPGVVNLAISQAVAKDGFYYVPDPSSQKACTIGGNVAENSGGPHCLAYGVTVNHVLGLTVVLPDGEVLNLGGATQDTPGYDLIGLLVGSEGTLGLVTEVIVRLTHLPETVATLLAVFDDIDSASNSVSAIIAAGIIPAALEMMDRLAIQAVEAAKPSGYPTDAAAVLLIDLEGFREGLDDLIEQVEGICLHEGARLVKRAAAGPERDALWAGRKGAFGAMGRISRSYYVQDGVIPRTKLPWMLKRVAEVGQKYGFRIANTFHAGDGNLHPLILFDETDPDQVRRVIQAGGEILQACVDVGGSITGEHGVGLEKREEMARLFEAADLLAMEKVHKTFNPKGLCNPGKIFPTSKACYEVGKRHRWLAHQIKEIM